MDEPTAPIAQLATTRAENMAMCEQLHHDLRVGVDSFDLYNILSVHGRRTLLIVATFTIYSARTLDYHCSLR